MAKKKITDLQLISSIADDLNLPSDNGIQSYRATSLQLKNYVLSSGSVGATQVAADAITTAKVLDGAITRSKLADGAVAKKTVASKSANYTLTNSDDIILVDATGGSRTMTLPALSGITGKEFTIRKTDSSANSVILDGDGSETIEGATTFTLLKQNDTVTIVANGTSWIITGRRMAQNSESLQTLVVAAGGSTRTCIAVLSTSPTRNTMGQNGIINYENTTANGASFTATKRCLVHGSYTIGHSGSYEFGWSINNTQYTTFLGSIAASGKLSYTSILGVSVESGFSMILEIGDVVRPHTKAGTPSDLNTPLTFTALEL